MDLAEKPLAKLAAIFNLRGDEECCKFRNLCLNGFWNGFTQVGVASAIDFAKVRFAKIARASGCLSPHHTAVGVANPLNLARKHHLSVACACKGDTGLITLALRLSTRGSVVRLSTPSSSTGNLAWLNRWES